MAEPVRKDPALSPPVPGLPEDEGDPFLFGFRLVSFRAPDGGVELRDVPLPAERLLNPRIGDHLTQGSRHFETVQMLYDMIRRRYEAEPDVLVCSDLKIRWGVRGMPAPAPDARDVWLIDAATGERLLTARELQQLATREAEARRKAEERAEIAEAEVSRLREEIARLKGPHS